MSDTALQTERATAAEDNYQAHVWKTEDREIVGSEAFYAVRKNRLRCHYWVISEHGRQKKVAFTVEFHPGLAKIIDSTTSER